MPRKPQPKLERITVVVDGKPTVVSLYPPNGPRKTWYAYWQDLDYAKSTGCKLRDDAVIVCEQMVRNGGERIDATVPVLSDDEFIEIQRRHFAKKTSPEAQERAKKSLSCCLDAIDAFKRVSGLSPITLATPDDCERFQNEALKLLKNWRLTYAENARSKKRRSRKGEWKPLSPNTVRKWLVALQAAFERANRNGGKKCVRGVVPEARLLDGNPWKNFTWIEGSKKKLRQFDQSELIDLLEHFAREWPGLFVAPVFVKVCLWSWARREEVARLRWSDERHCNNEFHFVSTGKWGVTKWFRIPLNLREELESIRTDSDFVFSGYTDQLRAFHRERNNAFALRQIRDGFDPYNLGEWVYRQIRTWSEGSPNGHAYLHVFRKTGLQLAVTGGHIEQLVANDASVTEGVLMSSYAQISDEELRLKSNRTYRRIRLSLPLDVARRYGYDEKPSDRIAESLDLARSQRDWAEVARLADELAKLKA